MANNLLVLVGIVIAVLVIWYFVFNQSFDGACKWCPSCGSEKSTTGKCPNCLITRKDAMEAIRSMAKGCVHRLRGVVRESMASASEISDFMSQGENRLVVITNVTPEEFVKMAASNNPNVLAQIQAVAISSSVIPMPPPPSPEDPTYVMMTKNYIVSSISNGNFSPLGAPTATLSQAVAYLDSTARSQLGPDDNTLVFFIDEDIPCPEDTTMLPLQESSPPTENCCGGMRRY